MARLPIPTGVGKRRGCGTGKRRGFGHGEEAKGVVTTHQLKVHMQHNLCLNVSCHKRSTQQ